MCTVLSLGSLDKVGYSDSVVTARFSVTDKKFRPWRVLLNLGLRGKHELFLYNIELLIRATKRWKEWQEEGD